MHPRSLIPVALLAVVSITIVLGFSACEQEPIGAPPEDPTDTTPVLGPCDTGVVYFQNDIMPWVNSSCAIPGCHDNATPAANINLSSYSAIMNSKVLGEPIVKPGDWQNSKLARAVYGLDLIPMPPLFNLAIPGQVKLNIRKWIEQGAQNNACDAVCDTVSYRYSTDIAPLMRKYCSGCHYGDYALDGVLTTTYNKVKALVDDDNLLYKVITGAPGVKRMPTGNVMMPECDIIKVRKWIEDGAPNN